MTAAKRLIKESSIIFATVNSVFRAIEVEPTVGRQCCRTAELYTYLYIMKCI